MDDPERFAEAVCAQLLVRLFAKPFEFASRVDAESHTDHQLTAAQLVKRDGLSREEMWPPERERCHEGTVSHGSRPLRDHRQDDPRRAQRSSPREGERRDPAALSKPWAPVPPKGAHGCEFRQFAERRYVSRSALAMP